MKEQKDYNLLFVFLFFAADPEGPGFCAFVLTFMAGMLLVITLPFSLCTCIKVIILVIIFISVANEIVSI